jgi:sialate O-acetylesterase
VQIASIFQDSMVLQQQKKVFVWGTASDGHDVVITFNGQLKKTKAKEGNWRVTLDPMEAVHTGIPLTAECDGVVITLNHILVGEVWIASGQSNMGMYTQYLRPPFYELVMEDCEFDGIRVFTQPEKDSRTKETSIADGKWNLCNATTVKLFSTVGFLFARQLHKALGVPVGIVTVSVGGSRIEKFLDHDLLKASGYPFYPDEDYEINNYNAMVHPLKSFRARGLLWYQGEANGNVSEFRQYYANYLSLLTNLYAENFGGDEAKTFPVLVVQLPIYSGIDADYKEIRIQQMLASQQDDRIFMTVNVDAGSVADIHPSDKESVGRKLTNMALAKVYGIDAPHKYPIAVSAVVDHETIVVQFKEVDLGLEIKGGAIQYLVVCDRDNQEYPATAQIVGKDTIVVRSDAKDPIGVSYAYQSDLTNVNFFDQNKLPVAPFRLDIGEKK